MRAGREGRRPADMIVVVALLLTGLSMRTAPSSAGAVLDDLQRGLHASATEAGLITTLPVLCFAAMGALTPRLAATIGPHRLLVIGLVVATAGLALRAASRDTAVFSALSVLALAGGALSNVLMPSLVKEHFPDRIGPMTALYTTALALGATGGAGVTVPLGDRLGGWRWGLGAWAVLTAVAALPWLSSLGLDRGAGRATAQGSPRRDAPGTSALDAPRMSMAILARSRLAWAFTAFFAAQSVQAYVAFGWFARFLRDHGIDASSAGLMVAVYAGVGIPVSFVVPRVPPTRQRALLVGLCASTLVAYVGMVVAPAAGAWAWMVLSGVGGGTFPLVLTLISQRCATAEGTAALSAFCQAIGYVVAGCGPVLFGALFGATGSWALPMTVLFVALVVTLLAGWRSAGPGTSPLRPDPRVAPRTPLTTR